MRMCAASAAVFASAIARSNASRASSSRPSCNSKRALHAEEMKVARELVGERLDQFERCRCTVAASTTATARFSVTTGDGWNLLQDFVELVDLGPIRVFRSCRVRVNGGDRGLQLVGARAAMPQRLVDERQAFRDQVSIPQTCDPDPRASTMLPSASMRAARSRVLQQQQREQSHDLRLALKQVATTGARVESTLRTAVRARVRHRRSPNSLR